MTRRKKADMSDEKHPASDALFGAEPLSDAPAEPAFLSPFTPSAEAVTGDARPGADADVADAGETAALHPDPGAITMTDPPATPAHPMNPVTGTSIAEQPAPGQPPEMPPLVWNEAPGATVEKNGAIYTAEMTADGQVRPGRLIRYTETVLQEASQVTTDASPRAVEAQEIDED